MTVKKIPRNHIRKVLVGMVGSSTLELAVEKGDQISSRFKGP